jgi:hypothetical protein
VERSCQPSTTGYHPTSFGRNKRFATTLPFMPRISVYLVWVLVLQGLHGRKYMVAIRNKQTFRYLALSQSKMSPIWRDRSETGETFGRTVKMRLILAITSFAAQSSYSLEKGRRSTLLAPWDQSRQRHLFSPTVPREAGGARRRGIDVEVGRLLISRYDFGRGGLSVRFTQDHVYLHL